MKATLKKLIIENFKGIENLQLEGKKLENIYGVNEAGKTTIFDSYMWLLFGKNSNDKTDFSIKPIYKKTGETIHNIEVTVEGVFDIDGCETTYKRVFVEKWQKQRGDSEIRFTGNETQYYVDKLQCKKREYEDKIAAVFSPEIFKLLTDVWAFNNLHWEKRRQILQTLIPPITDEQIAKDDVEILQLIRNMNGSDIIEEKKKLQAKIREIKKKAEAIQPRIDENYKTMPEQVNVVEINKNIESLNIKLKNIDDTIQDIAKIYNQKNEKNIELSTEVNKLKLKAVKLKQSIEQSEINKNGNSQNEINKLSSKLHSLNYEMKEKEKILDQTTEKIKECNKLRDNYLSQFLEAKNININPDDSEFICKECKRPYDNIEEKREEIIQQLKDHKIKTLTEINKKGIKNNEVIKECEQQAEVLKDNINSLNEQIKSITKQIESKQQEKTEFKSIEELLKESTEYQSILRQINDIQRNMTDIEVPNYEKLNKEKEQINEKIKGYENLLHNYTAREEKEKRIEELKKERKGYGIDIAELEKKEIICERFEYNKAKFIEENLSHKFKFVKFKLFNKLNNGGLEPTCVTLCDCIPFSDANNAGKINAGLDIINTLSNHNDMYCPVFIDNAESVNELIETDNQVIRLVVIEKSKDPLLFEKMKDEYKKEGTYLEPNLT
jgi:chromosome segregation ATPase